MVPWASEKEWVEGEVFEYMPLYWQARLLGLLSSEVCLGGAVYPVFGRDVPLCLGYSERVAISGWDLSSFCADFPWNVPHHLGYKVLPPSTCCFGQKALTTTLLPFPAPPGLLLQQLTSPAETDGCRLPVPPAGLQTGAGSAGFYLPGF